MWELQIRRSEMAIERFASRRSQAQAAVPATHPEGPPETWCSQYTYKVPPDAECVRKPPQPSVFTQSFRSLRRKMNKERKCAHNQASSNKHQNAEEEEKIKKIKTHFLRNFFILQFFFSGLGFFLLHFFCCYNSSSCASKRRKKMFLGERRKREASGRLHQKTRKIKC